MIGVGGSAAAHLRSLEHELSGPMARVLRDDGDINLDVNLTQHGSILLENAFHVPLIYQIWIWSRQDALTAPSSILPHLGDHYLVRSEMGKCSDPHHHSHQQHISPLYLKTPPAHHLPHSARTKPRLPLSALEVKSRAKAKKLHGHHESAGVDWAQTANHLTALSWRWENQEFNLRFLTPPFTRAEEATCWGSKYHSSQEEEGFGEGDGAIGGLGYWLLIAGLGEMMIVMMRDLMGKRVFVYKRLAAMEMVELQEASHEAFYEDRFGEKTIGDEGIEKTARGYKQLLRYDTGGKGAIRSRYFPGS
ncbi:hypothetical protein BGX38DRAFT_1268996 [Terfezia claveryi]|nr:hypothetical protein BGX38DRAFT_1268996 [Terfezia claveryi]